MPEKLYGLIGTHLKHSFSAQYFNQKFNSLHIDAQYKLFELDSIIHLPKLIADNKNLCGLNVTIPFKQSVIPYLHSLSNQASIVNAVNTIKINSDTYTGYNTDVIGFAQTLEKLQIKNKTALIFGNGGAAQAIGYVLHQNNFRFQFVVRNQSSNNQISYQALNHFVIENNCLLINCTPAGMYPNTDLLPLPYDAINSTHICYDLIYNPSLTPFLSESLKQGAFIKNGLEMLQLQAEAAWQIWQQ